MRYFPILTNIHTTMRHKSEKQKTRKVAGLESRKQLHRVETQNDVNSPSLTPDSLGEPRQKVVAGS